MWYCTADLHQCRPTTAIAMSVCKNIYTKGQPFEEGWHNVYIFELDHIKFTIDVQACNELQSGRRQMFYWGCAAVLSLQNTEKLTLYFWWVSMLAIVPILGNGSHTFDGYSVVLPCFDIATVDWAAGGSHPCRCFRVIIVGLVQCVTPGLFFFWIFSLSLYVQFKA